MSEEAQPATVPVAVHEDRGLIALRQLDLTKIPDGVEIGVRMLKTTTGRWRVRLDVRNEKTSQDIGDRVMTFDDLVLDLHVFAGENLATAVLRQQASGAGKQL